MLSSYFTLIACELGVIKHLMKLFKLHGFLSLMTQKILFVTKWFLAILTVKIPSGGGGHHAPVDWSLQRLNSLLYIYCGGGRHGSRSTYDQG